jgi:hypothetical protein
VSIFCELNLTHGLEAFDNASKLFIDQSNENPLIYENQSNETEQFVLTVMADGELDGLPFERVVLVGLQQQCCVELFLLTPDLCYKNCLSLNLFMKKFNF